MRGQVSPGGVRKVRRVVLGASEALERCLWSNLMSHLFCHLDMSAAAAELDWAITTCGRKHQEFEEAELRNCKSALEKFHPCE